MMTIDEMKTAAQAEVDRLVQELAELRADKRRIADQIRLRVEQLEEADRVNRALHRPRRTRTAAKD